LINTQLTKREILQKGQKFFCDTELKGSADFLNFSNQYLAIFKQKIDIRMPNICHLNKNKQAVSATGNHPIENSQLVYVCKGNP